MRKLLGSLELIVLLVVIRLGDDAYGVPVRREVARVSRTSCSVATVYAALERLQTKGLVSSEVRDPTPQRGGRGKKYFRVTAKGVRAARESQRTFAEFWQPLLQNR
jgi:DNA-binding PadR family transcriptional regulator